jgi:polyketide synthase
MPDSADGSPASAAPARHDRRELVQALRTIERLQEALAAAGDRGAPPGPVAVTGIGCRFPGGAHDPESFWRLLCDGVDATGEFPAARADAAPFYDADPEAPGKAHVIRGGFLSGPVDRFEPAVFGISPREAVGMDPQQRLTLEVAWEALERSGYAPDGLEGSATGVFLGVSTTDYVRLRQQIGDIRHVDAYQLVGEPSFMAGRISYTLGLMGPSKVVDTACSSSLVALHDACQALRLGECDMALAGGVNLMLAPYGFVLMSKFRALSADGRCKTFDAAADGYGRGEGAGIVVLKRLADAQAAGDPILAVIRGTAVNHDGRSSGLSVPNPASQQAVLRQALAAARAEPSEIGYVEAHGTGTALGDPIELRALEAVIGRHHANGSPLLVGSVKTNVGHLESAAGVAGLIKLILCLQHGEIPPHLHFRQPNPNVEWDRLHVEVTSASRRWPDGPRVGGVSSFGASGTNAHVIVGEPPPCPASRARRGWDVFTLSARTEESLRESAARHAAHLDDHPGIALADLCYTTQVGRPRQRHGLAVVADSPRRVQSQLQDYADGGHAVTTVLPQARHRRVCWLFTGQGAQRAGMARELRDEPPFRQAFDRCAGLLDQDLAQPLESVLWPDPGQPSPIGDTRYTQPALFALEYALARLWEAWGIRPSVLLGHSVGEIAAACVAGVFGLEDAAALVSVRARLMSALPPGGAMAAVTGDEQVIQQALAGHQDVAIAGVNGPDEIVLSGPAGELDAVIEELGRLGIRASRLAVSHAFHSPLIGPVLGEFREAISGLTFSMPRVPLISNVTGRLWTAQEVGPDYWVRHAASPVLFRAGVRAVHDEGVKTFLELGPAPVLCGLAARGISDPDAEFIPSLRPGTSDLQVLAQAAGLLSLRGARVDWPAFHGGDQPRRVTLPSTPWHGDSFWFKPAAPVSAATGRLEGVGLRLRSACPTYELSPDDGAWDRQAHAGEAGQADLKLGALTAAAIAAAGDGLGGSWHCAEDAALCGAVLRHQGLPQTVQLSVLDVGDDQAVCEFRGITEAEEKAGAPWRLVARTALRRRPAAVPRRPPLLDPARYPQRRPVDPSALPAASADAIDQVLGGDRAGDVLVALVPAAAGWAAVADAATAAMAWAGAGDPPARMAAGVARMSCADPSRVRYVRGRAPERGTAGRAEFFDAEGVCLGGARATPPAVPDAPAGEPWRDPAELLYRVDWPEAAGASPPADDAAASLAGQGYLLFADRHGAADCIAGQLRSAGATAVVAPVPLAGAPGAAGGELVPDAGAVGEVLDSWLATTPAAARVVVCTGLDAPVLDETSREAIEEFTARADLLVIALTQQLTARPRPDPVKVTLLTRGAVAAEPAQAGHHPLAATCWGLGRVLALEHPDHWGGLIDLDPAVPAVESARLLEALARSPAEDEQALRGKRRLVSRLAPAPVPGTAPGGQRRREPPVRPDGTYLITGAFGGIGVALAHWLARAGAGRLVLLARSRLPARSQWDGELDAPVRSRVEAVRSLERLGAEVETVACDVTDEAAMTRLFRKLRDGRRPLRGVVHAAGVSAPQFVRDVRPQAYRAVWRPKVIGGWLTHRLSEGAPLDFFLGFSSIAATWGSQHLASYAAGNAFLTGLACQRAAGGHPGLAVEWGPWASNSGLFGEDVMEFLKSTGLRPLAPDQCLHLLGALLDSGEPHHVVCAADWSVFKPVMEARVERPLLAGIAVDGSPEAGEPSELRAQLLAVADEDPSSSAIRAGLLSGYLRTAGAQILGVAPGEIDPEADLMDGGLDSVMVMDIVRRCKRDLGIAVKAGKLFERTTVHDWADVLMEQFGWARDPARPAPPPQGTARPGDAGAEETAAGAGAIVGDIAGDTAGGPADPAWLARDVTLDPRIRPAGPAPVITAPHDILLTGSTGFIGAYLLSELLAATPATVHCLVRCRDAADGRQRIRDNFTRYLPWPAAAEDRIQVVRADLSDPMLGLPAEEFSALAGRIDAIVHNGAWVNFSYTYEQLRPVNVRGTEEILRLACHAAPIPVHHVSTYGIWGLPAGGRTVIGEDDDIAGAGRLVTGYVQSKWAAERLVELARERGVVVNVYRPGRVLGDSRTGACLTTHFTTRVIKGCIELGIAPQIDLEVEMTPVDYVAAAMVGIAFSGRASGSTYHLVNGRKMRFSEVIAVLRRRGWPVTPVPVQTWWDALRQGYGERPNELHPVMDVVEEFVVGGEDAIDYAVANADSALDGTGIACPPLDERLLRLYLDWMSAHGYLPVPRRAQGTERA